MVIPLRMVFVSMDAPTKNATIVVAAVKSTGCVPSGGTETLAGHVPSGTARVVGARGGKMVDAVNVGARTGLPVTQAEQLHRRVLKQRTAYCCDG